MSAIDRALQNAKNSLDLVNVVIITCEKDLGVLSNCLESVRDFNVVLAFTKNAGKDYVKELKNSVIDGKTIKEIEIGYQKLDFAELRNIAKSYAKARFVLSIDSDERLVNPEIVEPYCKYLEENKINGVSCNIVSVTKGNSIETHNTKAIRLFKSNLDFKHSIHEKIETDNYIDSEIMIAHSGYLDEETRKHKLKRNKKLLKKNETKSKYLYDKLTLTLIDELKFKRNKLKQKLFKGK